MKINLINITGQPKRLSSFDPGEYDSDSSNLDEIYSSAFTITDAPLPLFDKQPPSHRVIGQIIDDESMQFLQRLATLPLQKKLGKGGSSGPPLLKVRVRDVGVQKVK